MSRKRSLQTQYMQGILCIEYMCIEGTRTKSVEFFSSIATPSSTPASALCMCFLLPDFLCTQSLMLLALFMGLWWDPWYFDCLLWRLVKNNTSDDDVPAHIQCPQVSRRKVAKHRAEVAHSPVKPLGQSEGGWSDRKIIYCQHLSTKYQLYITILICHNTSFSLVDLVVQWHCVTGSASGATFLRKLFLQPPRSRACPSWTFPRSCGTNSQRCRVNKIQSALYDVYWCIWAALSILHHYHSLSHWKNWCCNTSGEKNPWTKEFYFTETSGVYG